MRGVGGRAVLLLAVGPSAHLRVARPHLRRRVRLHQPDPRLVPSRRLRVAGQGPRGLPRGAVGDVLARRRDDDRVAEHRRVVAAYGLPSELPAGADPDLLVELMGRDKKAVRGLTFVLDGPAGVEPVTGVERARLEEAFAALTVTPERLGPGGCR